MDGDGEELGEGDERARVGVRARELLEREGVAVRFEEKRGGKGQG